MHLVSCFIHLVFLHQKINVAMLNSCHFCEKFMLIFTYVVHVAESEVNRCWCRKKTGNTILKIQILISLCENICAKSSSALKKIAERSDGRTYLEPSASDRADHSSSNSCCFVLKVNICYKVLFFSCVYSI
jgi:hypothetical protein